MASMQPSQETGDIGALMQGYAEDAVRSARQHKIILDYSERSLDDVERLLSELHEEMHSGFSSSSQTEEQRLDEMSRVWGGYLGEVVRRRFGGEWTIEKYPAGDYLIVTLNVNGAKLFPAMKVHKRLTDGADENLILFYRNVRTRLEARPDSRIQ
jgi:hypothetical protein